VEPAIDTLLHRVDSKYTMVIVAAKRARQLLAGAKKKIDTPSDKPVTVALQELAAGVLQYQRQSTSGLK
jgi:DNA-directed RNA polymerase subunit omega